MGYCESQGACLCPRPQEVRRCTEQANQKVSLESFVGPWSNATRIWGFFRYKYLQKPLEESALLTLLQYINRWPAAQKDKIATTIGIMMAQGLATAGCLQSLTKDHLVKDGTPLPSPPHPADSTTHETWFIVYRVTQMWRLTLSRLSSAPTSLKIRSNTSQPPSRRVGSMTSYCSSPRTKGRIRSLTSFLESEGWVQWRIGGRRRSMRS